MTSTPESVIGTWKSSASNIPDYVPGFEYVSFSRDGWHAWEMVGESKYFGVFRTEWEGMRFERLDREGMRYRRLDPAETGESGYDVEVEADGDLQIHLIPRHGFRTTFQRVEGDEETALLRGWVDATGNLHSRQPPRKIESSSKNTRHL